MAATPSFVGCPTDGQLGPQPAPSKPDRLPQLSASAAAKLAYYAAENLGVLAPRGWHCVGLIGSSGSALIVTPQAHSADDLMGGTLAIRSRAVELGYSYGGTSGRFTVAKIAPRYFREGAKFYGEVARSEREIGGAPLPPTHRFPTDRLVRRSVHTVVVRTPPGRSGLGSEAGLAPSKEAITSLAMLVPEPDMDLVLLNVRIGLAPGLTDAIVRDAEAHFGSPAR